MEEHERISEGFPDGFEGKPYTKVNADVRHWASLARSWAYENCPRPKTYLEAIDLIAYEYIDCRYNWYGLWVSRFTQEQLSKELGISTRAVRNLLERLCSKSFGDGRPLRMIQKGSAGQPTSYALIVPRTTHKQEVLAGNTSALGSDKQEVLDSKSGSIEPIKRKFSDSKAEVTFSESAGQTASECSPNPSLSLLKPPTPFDPDAKRELQKVLDTLPPNSPLRKTTEMLMRGPSNGVADPGYHGIQISGNWDESYSSYPSAPSGSTVSPSITGTVDFCECVRKMQGGGRMRNEQMEWAGPFAEREMQLRKDNGYASVLIDGLGGESGLGNCTNANLLSALIEAAQNRGLKASLGFAADSWDAKSYQRRISASLERQHVPDVAKRFSDDIESIG